MKPSVAAARQTAAADQIASDVSAVRDQLDRLSAAIPAEPLATVADLARIEAKLDALIAALTPETPFGISGGAPAKKRG